MEIRQYLYLFRRWAWLGILGLVLGMAGGYFFSSRQTPIYQTSTKVMVSRSTSGTAFNTYPSYVDQQLAKTYVQLLSTQPIIDGVSEYLNYPVYSGQIASRVDQESPIITITVTNVDPQKAADIANGVVQVLIERNKTIQTGQYAASEESLQTQITQIEEQIASLQADLDNITAKSLGEQLELVTEQMEPLQEEVTQLQKDIALLTPAWNDALRVKVAEIQARLDQINPLLDMYRQIYTNLVVLGSSGSRVAEDSLVLNQLQSTLGLYQQIYLNLISSRENIRLARLQNTPNVVQIEEAAVPTSPVQPQPFRTTLLAGAVGLMLMAGVAFLIEYLDDTVKTPADIQRHLGLPVIGNIVVMNVSSKSSEAMYVAAQPRSQVAEAFRALRTNLEFADVNQPLHTLLVTSPGPGEGKTTTATNLTEIIAQGERNVILVDADLRSPKVHRYFSLPNKVGLSDLFRGNLELQTVKQICEGNSNIEVITSGDLPPNPAELLGSTRMEQILDEIRSSSDMIIIDTPPSLVSDSTILSAKVDGVILVIQSGKTNIAHARAALEQLNRVDARVLGVVLNRIPRNGADYYGGYKNYSNYYKGDSYHTEENEA
jgi:capsular exopolysaccharide synthesis family protein